MTAIPTSADLRDYQRYGGNIDARKVGQAWDLGLRHNFFHWPLEFKEVFDRGGFDVVLGNPPWEHTELKEKEWFETRRPDIVSALTGDQRKGMIEALAEQDPALYQEFLRERRAHDSISHFVRSSNRYPLCGRGRINTYAVFAELARQLINDHGRVGIIVPTGIATDDTTKYFFQSLLDNRSLVSLYDFENRKKIFTAVDSRMKFSLLTLTGVAHPVQQGADFVFFAQEVAELKDDARRFTLSAAEIALLNPNTRTCPIFRTHRDAEIIKTIFQKMPILVQEAEPDGNPWGLVTKPGLFNMTQDSHLFYDSAKIISNEVTPRGNTLLWQDKTLLPLLEAKMTNFFDHRAAGVVISKTALIRTGQPASFSEEDHLFPDRTPQPRYWVDKHEIEDALRNQWDAQWLLGWKQVTSSTNERTLIPFISPRVGIGHSLYVALITPEGEENIAALAGAFVSCLSSLVCDYVARQKLGGVNLTPFTLLQLPIIHPHNYSSECPWVPRCSILEWLLERTIELTYTSWDMQPFARDCGYEGPPFRWDEERRFLLRCELDAAYFHLYGITRDDVAYILETFPIVKRKDEERYGVYRTQQVILALYDAMAQAAATGVAYQTPLDPPPADMRVAHGGEVKINADNAISVYNIPQLPTLHTQYEELPRVLHTKR